MLFFQLSEPEYNQLRSVQEQLGLISGLISGTHPEYSLGVVTAQQWQALVKALEEVLGGHRLAQPRVGGICGFRSTVSPVYRRWAAQRCVCTQKLERSRRLNRQAAVSSCPGAEHTFTGGPSPHSRKQLDVLTGGLMAAFFAGVSMPGASPNPSHGSVLLASGLFFVAAAAPRCGR